MSEQNAQAVTQVEMDDLRAQANAATSGPWEASHEQYGPRIQTGVGHFDGEVDYPVWECDDPQDGCMGEQAQWMADAQFLAASRTTVPRLLATVDAMRPFVEALAAPNIGVCPHCHRSVDRHRPDCVVMGARAFLATFTFTQGEQHE